MEKRFPDICVLIGSTWGVAGCFGSEGRGWARGEGGGEKR